MFSSCRMCRFFLLLVIGCNTCSVHAEEVASIAAITQQEIHRHVEVLAADAFEGREAGSRGAQASAGYIVTHLQKFGGQPAGENATYFQQFGDGYRNILAFYAGSDPLLKQEIIILGAHYDHVGYGSQKNSYGPWGYIHNGADDNASGVSALLEIAQALQQEKNSRSILLAFWDAEEKGLLGSKHWVEHPTHSLAQVKCFINADMVGRLTSEKLEIFGSRTGVGLRQIVAQANQGSGLQLVYDWTMKDDSDHWSFFQKRLPVLMFHTGLHGDYHRPSDDYERLNYSGIEKISQVMLATTLALANTEQTPVFREVSQRETNSVQHSQLQNIVPPAPRLGLTWKAVPQGEQVQLVVSSISFGSAAQKAGIRVGDKITHLNQLPIKNETDFRTHILRADAKVSLQVERANLQPQELECALHGQPVRIGISWREDSAEPHTAIISYVIYGSPAHIAGLKPGDRILSLNGERIENIEDLSKRVATPHEQFTFLRERHGQIESVVVKMQ
jgi:Peptidase family M28/PDZ domain